MGKVGVKAAIESDHKRDIRFFDGSKTVVNAVNRQINWLFAKDRLTRCCRLMDQVVMGRRRRADNDRIDAWIIDQGFGVHNFCACCGSQCLCRCRHRVCDGCRACRGHPAQSCCVDLTDAAAAQDANVNHRSFLSDCAGRCGPQPRPGHAFLSGSRRDRNAQDPRSPQYEVRRQTPFAILSRY